MSLSLVRKKLEQAQKNFQVEQQKLGKELRKEIVSAIAKVIPEGWIFQWYHDSNAYDDENYHFDIRGTWLISERVPRKGKMIKEAVPQKRGMIDHGYGRPFKGIIQHAQDAEYEWSLDDDCEKREDGWDHPEELDDPGYAELNEPNKELGLTKKAQADLHNLFRTLDEEEIKSAFGDCATVVIRRNGKCTVNEEESDGGDH